MVASINGVVVVSHRKEVSKDKFWEGFFCEWCDFLQTETWLVKAVCPARCPQPGTGGKSTGLGGCKGREGTC